jgi:hypothetical protein
MPRYANPSFSGGFGADPGLAQVGATLGRALFGDPNAALQQRRIDAEIAARQAAASADEAHAGLYGEQTEGQRIQNGGARSLPETIAQLAASFRPAPPPVTAAPAPVAGVTPPDPDEIPVIARRPADIGAPLAAMLGAGGQAQGDKVDPSALAAMMLSMLGTDEQARRSMVGTGHTPGKEFALTSERADDIARNATDATYKKDTAVAGINNASDIPVAQIHAGASVRGAEIGAGATVKAAEIGAGSRERIAATKPGATGGKPKSLPAASFKLIDQQIDTLGVKDKIQPDTLVRLRSAAARRMLANGGNPAEAVNFVINRARSADGQGGAPAAPAPQAGPPVAGARQAADGKWYVKTGNGYSRVDQ